MSLKVRETVDLPESPFVVRGKESASDGLEGELRRRKAWCALRPLLEFVVVRRSLRVDEEEKGRALVSGF